MPESTIEMEGGGADSHTCASTHECGASCILCSNAPRFSFMQAEKSDNNLVKSKGQIIVKLTEGKGNHIKSLLPNNVCGCGCGCE